jgi:hypothetical protein
MHIVIYYDEEVENDFKYANELQNALWYGSGFGTGLENALQNDTDITVERYE